MDSGPDSAMMAVMESVSGQYAQESNAQLMRIAGDDGETYRQDAIAEAWTELRRRGLEPPPPSPEKTLSDLLAQ